MHPCPLLLRPIEWKNSYLKGTGTLSTGEEKPQNELISDPQSPDLSIIFAQETRDNTKDDQGGFHLILATPRPPTLSMQLPSKRSPAGQQKTQNGTGQG